MALNSNPLMLGVAPKERRLCAVLIARAEENFITPVEPRPCHFLLKTAGFSELWSYHKYYINTWRGEPGRCRNERHLLHRKIGGGGSGPGPGFLMSLGPGVTEQASEGESRVELMSHWLKPSLGVGTPRRFLGTALFWSPVTVLCPAVHPTLGIKCDADLRGLNDWGAESEVLSHLNRS